jgi:type II secretory pathway component PulF
MLPPAILLMVGVLAGTLVLALFLPLISLIQKLT